MLTPNVSALGYVKIMSDKIDEWRRVSANVLGMMPQQVDDELLLRMDDRVARLVVKNPPSEHSRPARASIVAGWECPSEEAWDRVASAIEETGVEVSQTGPSELYSEAFSCVDPAGLQCEFYYGAKVDPATPFVSPIGVEFVTGQLGLGHLTVSTPNCREAARFYHDVLGFQIRETRIEGTGRHWRWAFLSPNEREHSLALMDTALGAGQLMHLLIEVTSIDLVGKAMDRCLDGHAPMTASLGRHWNDEMLSFYLRSPSDFEIEYGFGGRQVSELGWTRREQGGSGAVSLWGHRVVRPDGTLGKQIGEEGKTSA